MTGGSHVIEVRNVYKKYGRKQVLADMSFTANKGEITCLIGINGVGKTTVMKAIMKLTAIQKGQIIVDGEPVTKDSFEKIAFIPDKSTVPLSMTVAEACDLMKDFYRNWNEQRAEELIAFFKLNKSDRLKTLSKGNLAKVNLLLGLALDADYVLMDEPFSGIDLFSREQIADVFTSELVEGRGVLLTTHEIGDVEHLIDRVVMIGDGKVLKEFAVEDMREASGKSVVDVMREVYRG